MNRHQINARNHHISPIRSLCTLQLLSEVLVLITTNTTGVPKSIWQNHVLLSVLLIHSRSHASRSSKVEQHSSHSLYPTRYCAHSIQVPIHSSSSSFIQSFINQLIHSTHKPTEISYILSHTKRRKDSDHI